MEFHSVCQEDACSQTYVKGAIWKQGLGTDLALDLVLLVGEAAQHASAACLPRVQAAGIPAQHIDVVLALVCQPVIQPANLVVCYSEPS